MKPLYRGIWAERLERGQDLPIGKCIQNKDIVLSLDFDSFDDFLDGWHSPERILEDYRNLEAILSRKGCNADFYLHFVCDRVGEKVRDLLNVYPECLPDPFERVKRLRQTRANLSDMKGIAMCSEQAALGQYLLQGVLERGYTSSFVNGVRYQHSSGKLDAHSFLVLSKNHKTFIFDIYQLVSLKKPSLLETEIPFTYELLKDKQGSFLVGATGVLSGNLVFFGIGDTVPYESLFDK